MKSTFLLLLAFLACLIGLASCLVLRSDPVVPRLEATRTSMDSFVAKDELSNGISAWIKARNAGEMDAEYLNGYAGQLEQMLDRRVADSPKPDSMDRAIQNMRNRMVFGQFRQSLSSADSLVSAQRAWFRQLLEKGYRQIALMYAINNPDMARSDAGFLVELLDLARSIPNEWAEKQIQALSGHSTPVTPSPQDVEPSQILKACVTVWVDRGIKTENGFGSADIVIGSAFFIEKDGYLLTNHHVIASEVDPEYEGYSRLFIRMGGNSQEKIPAQVVAWDSAFDVAILKVAVEAPALVPLSNSDSVKSGTRVLAFGSPGGLDNTVTSGITSNMDRRLLEMGDVMQIDAAVNPGNSGGPLFNVNGEFIGIVFAGIPQFQGVNFSVPAYWIAELLPRLANGGELKHPWFGVKLFEYRNQVRVLYVVPGSPAWNLGLNPGDVITSLGGSSIKSISQVYRLLNKWSPGELINLSWQIGSGSLTSIEEPTHDFNGLCILDERPRHPLESAARSGLSLKLLPPLFGFSAQDVSTSPLSVQLKIDQVIPGSTSDESGLSSGDILQVSDWVYDAKAKALYFIFSTSRRSQGYLPQVMQLGTAIDTEDFM